MNKQVIIILFIFSTLITGTIFGQTDSSLDKLLIKVKEASYYDSARVFSAGEKVLKLAQSQNNHSAIAKVYVYYGSYFFYIRNLDKADSYFKDAITTAEQAKDESTALLAKIRLAYLDFERGQKEKALGQISNFLSLAKNINDYNNQAEAINLIGIIKEYDNNAKEALTLYYQGLALSEKNNLKYYPAVFRNNLGQIKMSKGNDSAAYTDFMSGLAIAQRDNDMRLASHIQMNICILKVHQNKLSEAAELFSKVLNYSKENNLPLELSSNYLNMATAFLNKNDGNTALNYYDSAIVILEKHKLVKELNTAYLGKADVLFQLGRMEASGQLLKQIEPYFLQNLQLENAPYFYYQLYKIAEKKSDYKNALAYYTKYNDLRTEQDNKLNSKVIEQLQQNYNVQQKEIELEKEKTKTLLLEKSNQEQRYLKWFSIAAGIVIIILIIIYSYFRNSKKIKEQQQKFSQELIQSIEEERKRIARDLHDDIGQSLSMIKSKLVNEKTKINGIAEPIEKELGNVIEQTRELSRNLYPSNIEKIGLVRSVAALMQAVQSNAKLECSFEIPDEIEDLPLSLKTHLFRILQECVNNTLKHSGASGLKISVENKNDEFILIYQDNGVGMKTKKGGLSMGLLSMRERANIIGGNLDIDDRADKGFKLTLRFKNNKA